MNAFFPFAETTRGVTIRVSVSYLPEQSEPQRGRWFWAYHVRIENEGVQAVRLMTRHWIITDARGVIEEVRGDGVVGEQPRLSPGQSFQYTSGCVLQTPIGTMHGSYRFWRDDETYFDAEIAPFSLASPVRDQEAN